MRAVPPFKSSQTTKERSNSVASRNVCEICWRGGGEGKRGEEVGGGGGVKIDDFYYC